MPRWQGSVPGKFRGKQEARGPLTASASPSRQQARQGYFEGLRFLGKLERKPLNGGFAPCGVFRQMLRFGRFGWIPLVTSRDASRVMERAARVSR